MKAAPLLIAWHDDGSPIYTAHFEPHGKGRLATAGGDSNVRVRGPVSHSSLQRCLLFVSRSGALSLPVMKESPSTSRL